MGGFVLEVACDGSALGNPGPAGWAWVIDEHRWAAGGWAESTNNRAELQAVIEILRATAHTDHDVHVFADSKYVINSVTKWMPVWRLKGWKKANGHDVLNRDLMEQLWELVDALERSGRKLTFTWVKGHNNHALNEAADKRAHAVATAMKEGREPETGPGLSGGEPDATTRVWCQLDPDLADAIAQEATRVGTPAPKFLRQLVVDGWEAYRDRSE